MRSTGNGLPYALTGTEKLNVEHLTDVKKPEVPPDPSRRLYPGDRVPHRRWAFQRPACYHPQDREEWRNYKIIVSLFGTLTEATVPVAMVEAA